jgi:hypothetical protein
MTLGQDTRELYGYKAWTRVSSMNNGTGKWYGEKSGMLDKMWVE